METENLDETKNVSEPPKKKVRLWSAKDFRNKITTKDKVNAIQELFELYENDKEKYIAEYLNHGGSCMELFQLLGSDTPAVMLLEIINNILLQQIAANKPTTAIYDACRYFLQTHLASVNKMISLGSPRNERKVILKLLTSIVTFSNKLAKEILLHVNFNSANIEVLTKQTEEKDSVRSAFLHFIMSFFVEGEYSIVCLLLEKKFMLLSIFKGLRFDSSDIVVLVMNTLRSYLLETTTINRTTKMGIFNTHIVKDIINLYNWKGPYKDKEIDPNDKSAVNIAVHNFLIVLCTSHKYGVIFKDPNLGLGKKLYNNLMDTVVDSLERPWEHSYAGELVLKICGACPELTKTLWANIKTFLEPRPTENWLKTVKYAMALVNVLQLSATEFCMVSLSVGQLIQAIPSLVAPQLILKTIIPEDRIFEKPLVKLHCISLLVQFGKAIQSYCSLAQNHLNVNDYQFLKNSMNEYLYTNFLTAQELLSNWTKEDDVSYSTVEYIQTVLDLLDLYEVLCPQLLENLSGTTLEELLRDIETISEDTGAIKIRTMKLFLNFEPAILNIKSVTFRSSCLLALEFYCSKKDPIAYNLLKVLLKNAGGIFEDFVEEIDVWIDSFLDLSDVGEVATVFIEILKHTSDNMLEHISLIQKMTDNFESEEQQHYQDLLESLLHTPYDSSSSLPIKNTRVSPLLVGTLDYLENMQQTKNFKTFLNSVLINLLHLQISPKLLHKLVSEKRHLVSKPVVNYVTGWANAESTILTKTKLRSIEKFNILFLTGDVETFFEEENSVQYLHQALFYFTQLDEGLLTDRHLDNLGKVCNRFPKDSLGVVFRHPVLVQRFSPTRTSITNSFLTMIVAYSSNSDLKPFRDKITALLCRLLKKQKVVTATIDKLEVFGLDRYQCVHLLNVFSKMDSTQMNRSFLSFIYKLVSYLMKTYLTHIDFSQLLPDSVVISLSHLLTFLNKSQHDTGDCIELFHKFLETFPHFLSLISAELLESIFYRTEFCKNSAVFAGFLLRHRRDFIHVFEKHIDTVVKIKGLILPLLESVISINIADEILEKIYVLFEPSILKGLEKPNKAGPHFEKYKEVVVCLITKFMSKERCLSFLQKVQKFDVTEVFHVQCLTAIFTKVDEVSEKHLHNTLITLALATNLLFKKRDKTDEDWLKLSEIAQLTTNYYNTLSTKQSSYRAVCENEVFNLYCNYCLKHGLSGKTNFLISLKTLVQILDFTESEAKRLLDMTGSHSEFLEVALGSESECKKELFSLILVFCERWPALMQRNHVPILLSAYHGTMGAVDRTILILLQMYEKMAQQTNFYDFKPFLWGKAGASHYSVREDIQRALWRQPRMLEILKILEESKINNTICNHPLNLTLTNSNHEAVASNDNVYNLGFFLPLFGSLLVAENQVALLTFVKSGALSLTILGLSCNNKRVRLASCHVLSRLHYHYEAKSFGKDKVLQLCFIEALCRGLATLEDFKLNNFCSIFWARMALILINPLHPMYLPISRYLLAKPTPDLSGIPELYTFLHIPDVNFKEPRDFILKVLHDGMRTNADCSLVIFKMGFKLLMELFSSCISDLETKILILKITERACRLDLGKEILCGKHGLLSWLYDVARTWGNQEGIIELVLLILVRLTEDVPSVSNISTISLIVAAIINDGLLPSISKKKDDFDNLLKVLLNIFDVNNECLTVDQFKVLISAREDVYCKYLLDYGSQFFISANEDNLLRKLVKNWLNKT